MSVERFMAKVRAGEEPEHCWTWQGAVGSDGYGRLRRKGKTWSAHRYSYTLFKSPIPDGLCVLHCCDNPRCVNPRHLFLGTKLDNSRDMFRKGRQGEAVQKLRADQVREIRRRVLAGEAKTALAQEFGVCRSTIQDIANNESWGSILEDSRQGCLFR